MIRLISLGLVLFALCVTPVAADEDVYDGPTAIRPLTVTPQPQNSARPNTVCDFEHHCYPEKGGPRVQAPVAPPVVAATPAAPPPKVPDEPIVATWRDCIGRALQSYEQSHNVHALQAATDDPRQLLDRIDVLAELPRLHGLAMGRPGEQPGCRGPPQPQPCTLFSAIAGDAASANRLS